MIKKDMSMPSEKQVLIYKAIVDLINEGADVNRMKVGEITARAGIGKGTAYEYFTSKEEMVKEALIYNTLTQIETVKEMVINAEDFRAKFMCILNYMEANKGQIKTFLWMMRILGDEMDISALGTDGMACEETMEQLGFLAQLASWFLEFGKAENLFANQNQDHQISALIAQIVHFGFYLHFGGDRDLEEVKDFLYDGFIKQLN